MTSTHKLNLAREKHDYLPVTGPLSPSRLPEGEQTIRMIRQLQDLVHFTGNTELFVLFNCRVHDLISAQPDIAR